MNIRFIGFGHIAKAMAQGLKPFNRYQLAASAPHLEAGASPEGFTFYANNLSQIHSAEIIILAVKPKQLFQVLEELKPSIHPQQLLVSLAAGVELSQIESRMYPEQAIFRAMPNLPVAVNAGATALMANHAASNDAKKIIHSLFAHLGKVEWLNSEDNFHCLTAISGSGPAYMAFFLESFIQASMKIGLDEDLSRIFIQQTCAGTLDYLQKLSETPENFCRKVSSPGGTTEAALKILAQENFSQILAEAIQSALNRAKEIALTVRD